MSYVKKLLKSRTVKVNLLSFATVAVSYVAMNPATFAITAPIQLAVVNIVNVWLRTKTTEAIEDK